MAPDLHALRPTIISLLRALPLDGSVRSLARTLDWHPPQVQAYLGRLLDDGLATRQASGWALTPLGAAVLRGVERAQAAYLRETTGHEKKSTQTA